MFTNKNCMLINKLVFLGLIFVTLLTLDSWNRANAQQVDRLIQQLQSTEANIKINAAEAIILEPTSNRVSALLAETAYCTDLAIRKQLLRSVERINAENYTIELTEIIGQQKNNDLREAARTALLLSSSPQVIDALVNLANFTEDQRLIRDIGRTLSNVRSSEAVSRLCAALHSSNIVIVAGCAAALGAIGTEEAVRGLVAGYAEVDQVRKTLVLEAIAGVRNSSAIPVLNMLLQQVGIENGLRESILTSLSNMQN